MLAPLVMTLALSSGAAVEAAGCRPAGCPSRPRRGPGASHRGPRGPPGGPAAGGGAAAAAAPSRLPWGLPSRLAGRPPFRPTTTARPKAISSTTRSGARRRRTRCRKVPRPTCRARSHRQLRQPPRDRRPSTRRATGRSATTPRDVGLRGSKRLTDGIEAFGRLEFGVNLVQPDRAILSGGDPGAPIGQGSQAFSRGSDSSGSTPASAASPGASSGRPTTTSPSSPTSSRSGAAPRRAPSRRAPTGASREPGGRSRRSSTARRGAR